MDFEKAKENIGMAVHVKHSSGQNRNGIVYLVEERPEKRICVKLPNGYYLNSRRPSDVFEGHATENIYKEYSFSENS